MQHSRHGKDQIMDMDQIIATLTELGIDPYTRDAYARDPEGYLAAAGVPAEMRDALARRDWQALDAGPRGGAWARCAACGDPGPDPLPGVTAASLYA
jgi:hypothetical protein